jgi:hypothetical protein
MCVFYGIMRADTQTAQMAKLYSAAGEAQERHRMAPSDTPPLNGVGFGFAAAQQNIIGEYYREY